MTVQGRPAPAAPGLPGTFFHWRPSACQCLGFNPAPEPSPLG